VILPKLPVFGQYVKEIIKTQKRIMSKQIIIKKLTEVFREVFNNDQITLSDEMTAQDVGSWDSLSHMLMIEKVEKRFDFKFKLREITKLKNVGVLLDLIEKKTTS
jgi:acyl carrier protein